MASRALPAPAGPVSVIAGEARRAPTAERARSAPDERRDRNRAGCEGRWGSTRGGAARTRVRARRRGPRLSGVQSSDGSCCSTCRSRSRALALDRCRARRPACGGRPRTLAARPPGDRPGTAPARAARADACAVASAAPVGTRPRSRHDDDPSATAGPSGVRSRPTAAPEPRDLTASDMPVGDVLQRLAPPQPERPLHLLQRGHQLGLARSAASVSSHGQPTRTGSRRSRPARRPVSSRRHGSPARTRRSAPALPSVLRRYEIWIWSALAGCVAARPTTAGR